ncbi:MAG: F0F1 ATP synthase subunit A [Polyangia bacterium]
MPDHTTWFNLLPDFSTLVARFREALGLSYLEHAPISVQYVAGFAFVGLLILLLVLTARGRIAKTDEALVPDGKLNLRTFFEMMVEGTLSTMEGMMDRRPAVFFLPLIGSCAFIILFSNLLGLVPGFLPPTSNWNTTLAMSLVIFFTTHIYGIKEHGLGYFAHWFGPFRKWYALPLMLLIFVIEVISHLARPLSLSIRLMGNMFADHAVVATFTLLVPILVPLPMLIMGVLVCIVQTAVFCILSMVYIGMAIVHEKH